jgi:hypothetical protein
MYWPPTDSHPYDEPYDPFERRERLERLRHLVFLDGQLVDSWTERVEGTRWQVLAAEKDDERLPRYRPEPVPPLHERVLVWLDGAVGGRRALLALDDEPLVSTADPTDDTVDELLRRAAEELFDAEFLLATRAMLTALRSADAELAASLPDAELAAGICWLAGRANGVVGQGTTVNQKMLKRVLWLSTSPSRRIPRIKAALRGLRPDPAPRPADCPELLELGVPGFLTSATRRRLIALRDRALQVAEEVEADRLARAAPAPGDADSLRT